MEYVKLTKKIGIYFIGNLSTKLMSSIMIFIYAFYINAENLGRYEYIQTLSNIIVPIAFISIWESILKYTLSTKIDNEKMCVINTSAIFSIIISILLFVLGILYYQVIKNEQYSIYIILIYIFFGLSNIWQYYSRCLNETKMYVKSSVIGSFTNLMLILILICIFKLNIMGLFIANILGNCTILIFLEFKMKILKKIHIKNFDVKLLKRMLIFSFPLVINDISLWLITGFGKAIIQTVLGESANGLYSFANKFTIIVNLLGLIINKALTEEMLVSEKKDTFIQLKKIMQELIEKLLVFLILSIPIIMIFYSFIIKTEYYQSKIYVPLLLIYSFIMLISTNLSIVFKITEKTEYQFIATLTGAIITVIISILLINKIKIFGVILGQIIGGLINVIFRYKISKRLINLDIYWNKNFVILMIYLLISILSLRANLLQNIIFEIIILMIFLIIYSKEIRNILNKIF